MSVMGPLLWIFRYRLPSNIRIPRGNVKLKKQYKRGLSHSRVERNSSCECYCCCIWQFDFVLNRIWFLFPFHLFANLTQYYEKLNLMIKLFLTDTKSLQIVKFPFIIHILYTEDVDLLYCYGFSYLVTWYEKYCYFCTIELEDSEFLRFFRVHLIFSSFFTVWWGWG